MSFVLNQVIGNYQCLGIVDRPRAGVTYKVRNLNTGEIEALRALPGSVSRDPDSAERLMREIRIQARLAHPNVQAFHDAFEVEGCMVMTTEYVEAPTLAQLCHRGPLPPGFAIGTILQVLDGLEEAHALGIVHRGIIPEHVMILPTGAVKLGGFDLAKPVGDANLTRVGTVAGDPRYISPEQVMGSALDGRSDLYSVGILLFQALTGKLPFEGGNDFEVLAAQVGVQPPAPSKFNPAVSPALDHIVLTALRKDPAERFANAKEFRIKLAGIPAPMQPTPMLPVALRPAAPVMQTYRPPAPQPLPQLQPIPEFHLLQSYQPKAQGVFPTQWVFCVLALMIGLGLISWVTMH